MKKKNKTFRWPIRIVNRLSETKSDRNSWKGFIRGGKGWERQTVVCITKNWLHELCRRNPKVCEKCKHIVKQTSMSNELRSFMGILLRTGVLLKHSNFYCQMLILNFRQKQRASILGHDFAYINVSCQISSMCEYNTKQLEKSGVSANACRTDCMWRTAM